MSEFYPREVFERQADALLTQATPVAGTEYTVLATTKDVRIYSAVATATWTVQPNPMELHFTIDGVIHSHAVANPVSTTDYVCLLSPHLANTAQLMLAQAQANDLTAPAFLYEGKSVSVTVDMTGGTTNPVVARVKYGIRP